MCLQTSRPNLNLRNGCGRSVQRHWLLFIPPGVAPEGLPMLFYLVCFFVLTLRPLGDQLSQNVLYRPPDFQDGNTYRWT